MNSWESLKYFESSNFSDCKVVSFFLRNKVPFEPIEIKQLNVTWAPNLKEATYLNGGILGISHWRLSFRGINYLNFFRVYLF